MTSSALSLTSVVSATAARTLRLLAAVVLVTLAAHVAHAGFGVGRGFGDATQWLFNALLIASVLACVARATLVRTERAAWLALAAGMALWTLGNLYFTVYLLELEAPPFPSLADAGYLLFYPFAYVALVLLVRERMTRFHASVWLDGLVGALAVAALGAALVLTPVLASTSGGVAAVATNLAYPLGDVLLIAFVVGIFALTGWRPGGAWLLIGFGLVTLAVADSLYLYRVAMESYEPGTVLDSIWPAGMVLLAWAAWQRTHEDEAVSLEGWAVLVVPSLFTASALGVLIYGNLQGINAVALVLATLAVVAAIVRTGLTFREVRSLSESRRQALTDELTGLPNRRFLLERVSVELKAARDEQRTMGLLIIDLDRFKELNDTLGHHAGDALLQQIGPRLRETLRDDDVLARLGGDEFAVLVPRGAGAAQLAERIRAALEQPFAVDGLNLPMEASVGIALFPEHGIDAATLLQRADVAMYQAKGARTGSEVYDPGRDLHSRERLTLMGELRNAISAGELVLFYQPKADVDSGRVTGVEALVRWAHPERGLVPPDEFLPVAEQTGLMRPLTLWVLETALRQSAEWRAAGTDLRVAVNVSLPDLLDLRFPEDLLRLLNETGVDSSRLQLEITENVVMADPVRVMDVLARISELGIELSLDDYGTGTSSLSYLKRLPVRELKIDRSFVMNMEAEERDAVIVRSTVELARSLGLRVVAEGVESAEAWSQLSEFGCEIAQGYYLSRPVPGPDVTSSIERWHASGAPSALRPLVPDILPSNLR